MIKPIPYSELIEWTKEELIKECQSAWAMINEYDKKMDQAAKEFEAGNFQTGMYLLTTKG